MRRLDLGGLGLGVIFPLGFGETFEGQGFGLGAGVAFDLQGVE